MPATRDNHYVPQWYQRGFLRPGQTQFHYLDLRPATVVSGGKTHTRRALLRWGPKKCFYAEDLYTMKFGPWMTDFVEKHFFGRIDGAGHKAVEVFRNFSIDDRAHDGFQPLVHYMAAQRFRTPRGLDWLKAASGIKDHNYTLGLMGGTFQMHATMWTEGVWEIVHARQSPTKFIVSDEPVTFYNPGAFPGSPQCRYPYDVDLGTVGTRTIFPLDMQTCLIITHVQWTRDPWADPRRPRVNARAFQPAIMSLLDIQSGRELEDDEVRRINYILKKRATRYIAAANEEWLYPERTGIETHWSKVDADWFLFPNLYKVRFTTGIVWGGGKSGPGGVDEYGRRPRDGDPVVERRRAREWESHRRAREEWALKRVGRSLSKVHEGLRGDSVMNKIMTEDVERLRARRAAPRRVDRST